MQSAMHKSCNPIYLLACQIHYANLVLHMAAVRSRLLRPHARAGVIVCAKRHQSGDRSLYCIAAWILLTTGIGSPDGVEQFFLQADTQVNIYYCGKLSFDVAPFSVMTSRLPGSLKQTLGSGCLPWHPNDSARFLLRRILLPLFISNLLVSHITIGCFSWPHPSKNIHCILKYIWNTKVTQISI